ncbi:glycoside hydrolase [Dactylosporangium sp. NBC_01737]|uniref:sialidase family protein n=1 Tax=Dactylosporangium sp. NBC_01737 TaxID=2975959 RepID=UPI002E1304D8|nr:glycoside hydrolase [Dactylosporangium sp. NBC_01737]
MPDELETLLRAQRLDFDQPPMSAITARARFLRRRRRAVQAGAAALTLLAASVAFLAPRDAPAPQVAASPSPGGVWTGGGITVNGLPALPRDLPGKIDDAEFIDADRGFLLTRECAAASCTAWVSASTDGGRTWSTARAPGVFGTPPLGAVSSLVVTGSRITLVGADGTRSSSTDGVAWDTATGPPALAAGALPGDARLILLGGQVAALLHDGTSLVTPAAQPPLTVHWVSPVRAGSGSWWVGGAVDGRPAVAVSRDDGATWKLTTFAGTGTAQVAFLGTDVYVAVTDPRTGPPGLTGVAASTDGGAQFTDPRPVTGTTIGGDLVPLLDGRLLFVDGAGHWLVSTDRGATWQRVSGLHPTERLARTQVGWVAYGMSTIYTAYSVDGATWQKLDAQ